MLQVAFIQENKEDIIARLAKRNIDATEMINEAIAFDEDRKAIQTKLDNTKAESNSLSKEIGNLFKSGETQKANILKVNILKAKVSAAGAAPSYYKITTMRSGSRTFRSVNYRVAQATSVAGAGKNFNRAFPAKGGSHTGNGSCRRSPIVPQ